MRIEILQSGNELTLTAELSEGDRELAGKARLVHRTATFKLTENYNVENTHPDLLALAGLITFYPWIGDKLDLSFPVSRSFANTVKAVTKITLPNSTAWIPDRGSSQHSHPGLSFSAGVDSMAALALMPTDAVPVFTLRTAPPNGRGSLYKPEVALHAISEMGKAGKLVHVVESDHEWVRDPVGFSVDPAPAVPLVLLADELDLDAVTFGTIAESSYATGKGTWLEYRDRVVFKRWRDLFEAVGLGYYNATAGVSEIGTSTIVRSSEFGYLAQSCIRGIPGHPCQACVKCFRKSLITAALTGEWPERVQVSLMMANRTIKAFLEQSPIRFEIILTAAMASYTGDDPLLLALQARVGSKVHDVSFTHAWYPPAMELIPDKYQESTIAATNSYLPEMTTSQMQAFRSFNISPFIETHTAGIDEFRATLDANVGQTTAS